MLQHIAQISPAARHFECIIPSWSATLCNFKCRQGEWKDLGLRLQLILPIIFRNPNREGQGPVPKILLADLGLWKYVRAALLWAPEHTWIPKNSPKNFPKLRCKSPNQVNRPRINLKLIPVQEFQFLSPVNSIIYPVLKFYHIVRKWK